MDVVYIVIACVLLLTILGGYLWTVAWTIGDAQKRGHDGSVILLLIWLFGPLAAIIWLIARPKQALVERSPDDYSDPDDALAAASRLDLLGDWDAAITLYRSVATRWPEHSTYIENCITEIKRKQAAT